MSSTAGDRAERYHAHRRCILHGQRGQPREPGIIQKCLPRIECTEALRGLVIEDVRVLVLNERQGPADAVEHLRNAAANDGLAVAEEATEKSAGERRVIRETDARRKLFQSACTRRAVIALRPVVGSGGRVRYGDHGRECERVASTREQIFWQL